MNLTWIVSAIHKTVRGPGCATLSVTPQPLAQWLAHSPGIWAPQIQICTLEQPWNGLLIHQKFHKNTDSVQHQLFFFFSFSELPLNQKKSIICPALVNSKRSGLWMPWCCTAIDFSYIGGNQNNPRLGWGGKWVQNMTSTPANPQCLAYSFNLKIFTPQCSELWEVYFIH